MAARSGKQGLVQYKGVPVFRINDWSLDVNVDMRDHTSFSTGALFWRSVAPGLAGASGTITGFWDPDGSTAQDDMIEAVLAGSTGSCKLEADKDTGGSLTFNSYFSGMSAGAAVDGDATVSFNVTANGAVTYSTTT